MLVNVVQLDILYNFQRYLINLTDMLACFKQVCITNLFGSRRRTFLIH